MTKANQKTLTLFQCERNRHIEEDFAQTISENNDLQLFFINENRAFTDGRTIVVDPATRELFADATALFAAKTYLKLEHEISQDTWLALCMITRAQSIH